MRKFILVIVFIILISSYAQSQINEDIIEADIIIPSNVLPKSGGSMAGDINLTGSASLKGPNNSTLIKARNAANTADINLLSVNTSDQTVIGQGGANNIIIFDQRLVGEDDDTGIKMNGVNNIEFWGNGVVVASISRVIGVRIYDGDFIFNTDASGDIGKTGANRPDSIYAKSLVSVEAGGIKISDNGGAVVKPTCSVSERGKFWMVEGNAGVKDTIEVCAKDAADAYAWRTIY
ncbi:MAG: hypothetical protein RIG61_07410 [Deltaproteobacteria bacterium]